MIRDRNLVFVGLLVTVIFVIIGSFWFSQSRETLDQVAERFGAEESPVWKPPLPDYAIHGFEGNMVLNVLVGVAFGLLVFGVTMNIGRILRTKRKDAE